MDERLTPSASETARIRTGIDSAVRLACCDLEDAPLEVDKVTGQIVDLTEFRVVTDVAIGTSHKRPVQALFVLDSTRAFPGETKPSLNDRQWLADSFGQGSDGPIIHPGLEVDKVVNHGSLGGELLRIIAADVLGKNFAVVHIRP